MAEFESIFYTWWLVVVTFQIAKVVKEEPGGQEEVHGDLLMDHVETGELSPKLCKKLALNRSKMWLTWLYSTCQGCGGTLTTRA